MMEELVYRNATLDDLPAIVAIYNSTIAGRMVTADLHPVSVESRMEWFNEHTPDKRPLWMVEDSAKNLIGWASFQNFYGREAYKATAEISIYLHPSSRGKGYGTQVLQYCMVNSYKYGIKTLLGYIFAHNINSLQLFYKLGFEDWATLPNIAELDGVERSLKILGKRIYP